MRRVTCNIIVFFIGVAMMHFLNVVDIVGVSAEILTMNMKMNRKMNFFIQNLGPFIETNLELFLLIKQL